MHGSNLIASQSADQQAITTSNKSAYPRYNLTLKAFITTDWNTLSYCRNNHSVTLKLYLFIII